MTHDRMTMHADSIARAAADMPCTATEEADHIAAAAMHDSAATAHGRTPEPTGGTAWRTDMAAKLSRAAETHRPLGGDGPGRAQSRHAVAEAKLACGCHARRAPTPAADHHRRAATHHRRAAAQHRAHAATIAVARARRGAAPAPSCMLAREAEARLDHATALNAHRAAAREWRHTRNIGTERIAVAHDMAADAHALAHSLLS